ncbi:hypothetical protein SLEP1_g38584 [Rubroshorea leprosula]|uniref:Uncharacterized protein n=1 Tax=Rubroshorea leprosula TaxID=152421 RepID=A0AAV5KY62_9ROSI|nr:hypothetical protein SLEP1_g38584 [Rubroshorea leprosula]
MTPKVRFGEADDSIAGILARKERPRDYTYAKWLRLMFSTHSLTQTQK